MTIELNGITLEEAKAAHDAMLDLQRKAELYPILQRQKEKEEAAARLSKLKEQCQTEFNNVYEDYDKLANDFRQSYQRIQQQVKEVAAILKRYKQVSGQLALISDDYAQAAWQFDLSYNNADAYKNGNESVYTYRAEVATKPFSKHPIDKPEFNQLYDVIAKNIE